MTTSTVQAYKKFLADLLAAGLQLAEVQGVFTEDWATPFFTTDLAPTSTASAEVISSNSMIGIIGECERCKQAQYTTQDANCDEEIECELACADP